MSYAIEIKKNQNKEQYFLSSMLSFVGRLKLLKIAQRWSLFKW